MLQKDVTANLKENPSRHRHGLLECVCTWGHTSTVAEESQFKVSWTELAKQECLCL